MDIRAQILAKAKSLGASLSGIADFHSLLSSPSHQTGDLHLTLSGDSVVVLALEHPENEPELDWWGDGEGGSCRLALPQEIEVENQVGARQSVRIDNLKLETD